MKKSISLKEFSTTPTVSCMLRKDGNNVAQLHDERTAPAIQRSAPQVAPQSNKGSMPQAENEQLMHLEE
jgi:hypothetical protein